MTEDQIRIVEALLTTAYDEHTAAVRGCDDRDSSVIGHTAIDTSGQEAPDLDCLHCGHINEAEYMIAAVK